MILLFILAVAAFAHADDILPLEMPHHFECDDVENICEFYGPLSTVYDGGDNLFFNGVDSVYVIFTGKIEDGKMKTGYAYVEASDARTIYLGHVEKGVMRDESAEIIRINSESSVEYYQGRFNGADFDSCSYANSETLELSAGKRSNGYFNDENAIYMGPLSKIYDGDFKGYATESDFFDFEPIHFDEDDVAVYNGPLKNGRVAGVGSLMVVHGGDTLLYMGQFENAKAHGIGSVTIGNLYSYMGHFVEGKIAGLGEISSSHFSDMFTQNELIPYDGSLNIKGIWLGHTGLGEYFRVTNENGDTVKLGIDEGKIKKLGVIQKAGAWISGLWIAEKLERHNDMFQKIIAGAAVVDAGACVGSLLIPVSVPVAGPVCSVGFFTIVGIEAVELTILSFRAIDRQCYSSDCIESTWKDYGKKQAINMALAAMPFAVGKIGEVATPILKPAVDALKESRYARVIASSKNAKVVDDLENLPRIEISKSKEIDIAGDRLAFKQAVVDYTGKNFKEGFVEFFVRLKTSGREDLIKKLWDNHKNFIKESGIRTGGVHEWLEAENFVDYLINPKWGKDGAYFAYVMPQMVQRTGNVVFKNGGAHHVYDAVRARYIPGSSSKSFHNRLGEKIASCANKECVFRSMNEHAKEWLTERAYNEYVNIERAVFQ